MLDGAAAARWSAGRPGSARPRCWPRPRDRDDARPAAPAAASSSAAFAFGGVQQLFAHVPVPDSRRRRHAAAAFSVGGEPDHAVLHGLYWLTAGLGPLALVVDDAHWLDRPSLRWLAYMVNRVADLPLAIVLAARGDEPDELLHPDRAAPVDDRDRAEAALAAAVAELGGDGAPPRSTRPPAATRSTCTRCSPTDGTPRPVVESIALRLDALPPPARRSPARSPSPAAAGRSPPGSPVSTCATTVEAAEALARADILRGDGFAHPLVAGRLRRDPRRRARASCTPHAARLRHRRPSGSPRS